MKTITKMNTRIGAKHQGRKMTLKAFEFAQGDEGYIYELARGYIVVSEVPNYLHACLVAFLHEAVAVYKAAHPGLIHLILGSMDCKLLIPAFDSERHPDLAVYLTAPKGPKNRQLWRKWIPELVIEVVSASSSDRDYVEKREEYWALSVKEYWIIDAKWKQVLLLKRGKSDWIEKVLHEGDSCETKLLPGFILPCQAIFAAAPYDEDSE